MFALQLNVDVSRKDMAEAIDKSLRGAWVNVKYPVMPRKGERFSLHPGIKPLKIRRVTHWGPGFTDGPWTELHFKGSFEDVELLLKSDEKSTFSGWTKLEP